MSCIVLFEMIWFLQWVLGFSLIALLAHAAHNVECDIDSITVRWIADEKTTQDPSVLFLGSCPPTRFSLTTAEAIFHVGFEDCGFMRMVTKTQLIYKNYLRTPDASLDSAIHPVACAYKRPQDWSPPLFLPHTHAEGYGSLSFQLGILRGGFCEPAQVSTFTLGSVIPICAVVAHEHHMPLYLFLEECVAANTQSLGSSSQIHKLVTNKGCLVDSMTADSRFQRFGNTSEIILQLQSFKFVHGAEVYIHCKLAAWDPMGLTEEKKACNYNKGLKRWELVNDPSQSTLCNCCDAGCEYEDWQEPAAAQFSENAVLGLRNTDSQMPGHPI
ncbi:zona pellucida sperm-binding protein 3-like isoform X2 [Brienomyrus brachyistius]|uniref:zona pellucida sperm-binding protein 3-like isoform X2 n=1 Tax=Brienomyrus brachyistius TaxID=42636 RepID=UPI0020B2B1B9|nr:zona pellucida sperm-binding protein 3-like isoform X2 [Brienomyrus brachyistius]